MAASDRPLRISGPGWATGFSWGWVAAALALVALLAWYATHPADLPAPRPETTSTTTPDTPVYVGMLDAGDRTLELRSVRLAVEGGEVTLLACRGGSISVTTDAQAFCEALEQLPDVTLHPGDQLIAKVTGPPRSRVLTQAPVVRFREGLQWGEGRTGRPVQLWISGGS